MHKEVGRGRQLEELPKLLNRTTHVAMRDCVFKHPPKPAKSSIAAAPLAAQTKGEEGAAAFESSEVRQPEKSDKAHPARPR